MSQVYIFVCTKTTASVALPSRAFNQVEYNRKISNTFRAAADGHLTVGDLKLRPNGDAIAQHLLCDGTAVSRVDFPELFALLGTTEGDGDGSTTFNLPNYLGAPVAVPAVAPVHTVTASGTVSSGATVTAPAPDSGQTGGTTGGNVPSGGRSNGIGPTDV